MDHRRQTVKNSWGRANLNFTANGFNYRIKWNVIFSTRNLRSTWIEYQQKCTCIPRSNNVLPILTPLSCFEMFRKSRYHPRHFHPHSAAHSRTKNSITGLSVYLDTHYKEVFNLYSATVVNFKFPLQAGLTLFDL